MPITTSELRGNIYQLLDRVLETGQPLEIERKGKIVKIIPAEQPSRIARLVKHHCLEGDMDDIVHLDWSEEWNGDLP
jgi:prevent-host-death family protein